MLGAAFKQSTADGVARDAVQKRLAAASLQTDIGTRVSELAVSTSTRVSTTRDHQFLSLIGLTGPEQSARVPSFGAEAFLCFEFSSSQGKQAFCGWQIAYVSGAAGGRIGTGVLARNRQVTLQQRNTGRDAVLTRGAKPGGFPGVGTMAARVAISRQARRNCRAGRGLPQLCLE